MSIAKLAKRHYPTKQRYDSAILLPPSEAVFHLLSSPVTQNTLRVGWYAVSFTPPECQIVCIIKGFGAIPYAFASVFIGKSDTRSTRTCVLFSNTEDTNWRYMIVITHLRKCSFHTKVMPISRLWVRYLTGSQMACDRTIDRDLDSSTLKNCILVSIAYREGCT